MRCIEADREMRAYIRMGLGMTPASITSSRLGSLVTIHRSTTGVQQLTSHLWAQCTVLAAEMGLLLHANTE